MLDEPEFSSHPCPTCCTDREVPNQSQFLSCFVLALECGRTFGRVTFGMMTTFNAEGASFLGALGSPPGWYWYFPEPPPSFQGSLSAACATVRSEEELVGDRAVRCE